MKNLKEKYKEFISRDTYISKEEMNSFLCANEKEIKGLEFRDYFFYKTIKNIEDLVNVHNETFIKRNLITNEEYFDTMFSTLDENIILDLEQRKAILTDEDYSMIIAGAGSGKTTTMAGKVKYLVDKKNINPEEILVISYTNKAVLELKEKINDGFKINAQVLTFHKLGNDILKKKYDANLKISTNSYNIIKDYFCLNIANDSEKLEKVIEFFSLYFDLSENLISFNKVEEYIEYKKKNEYETLKSKIYTRISNREDSKVTIKGEFLRSTEEVAIANFLFLNGIEYSYEKEYEQKLGGIYLPDFTIYYNEQIYYLEHFGIEEDGYNPYFSTKTNYSYRRGIDYKKNIHQKYNTDLIMTYSKYKDGRALLTHLREELEKRNIILNKINSREIYEMLVETSNDSYFTRFILFLVEFIKNFKNRGFDLSKFDELIKDEEEERTLLFLNIAKEAYEYYDRMLKQKNSIDFEDMINDSYLYLKSLENNILDYKYIIIDEYQDISLQRFNLTKEIARLSKAKVVAVGDDWQAIFAFAGSDVTLFTKFKELMGYGVELQITNTYRNSQELIDIAGNFVMQNKLQIPKKLFSKKHLAKPLTIYTYDDYLQRLENRIKTVDLILTELVEKYGEEQKILFIGRYNFDRYQLTQSENYYEYGEDKIRSMLYPRLDITYLTAHSSKGLGFDNVVIINGSGGKYGFPSLVKDDPIFRLININDDSFSFAEERRLFYVAITRSKNKVYVVSPVHNQSPFIKEIVKYKNVELKLVDSEVKTFDVKCPKCGFYLVKRNRDYFTVRNVYECSNEKELCSFKTNNLKFKKEIKKCSKCDDGFLIVKRSVKNNSYFIGCTNFENGCRVMKHIDF